MTSSDQTVDKFEIIKCNASVIFVRPLFIIHLVAKLTVLTSVKETHIKSFKNMARDVKLNEILSLLLKHRFFYKAPGMEVL